MTSLKKIAASISMIGLLAAAPAAIAGGGALTLTADPVDIGWLSAGFDNSFSANGFFTDDWTFSVPANLGATYSVDQSWNFNVAKSRLITGINNFQVSLYKDSVAPGNWVAGGLQYYVGGLASGNYILEVTGDVAGTQTGTNPVRGSYTGLVEILPVPEPESYALFLAGLGLMGFIARRLFVRLTAGS